MDDDYLVNMTALLGYLDRHQPNEQLYAGQRIDSGPFRIRWQRFAVSVKLILLIPSIKTRLLFARMLFIFTLTLPYRLISTTTHSPHILLTLPVVLWLCLLNASKNSTMLLNISNIWNLTMFMPELLRICWATMFRIWTQHRPFESIPSILQTRSLNMATSQRRLWNFSQRLTAIIFNHTDLN